MCCARVFFDQCCCLFLEILFCSHNMSEVFRLCFALLLVGKMYRYDDAGSEKLPALFLIIKGITYLVNIRINDQLLSFDA